MIGNSYHMKTLREDAHDAQVVRCRFVTARQRTFVQIASLFLQRRRFAQKIILCQKFGRLRHPDPDRYKRDRSDSDRDDRHKSGYRDDPRGDALSLPEQR